jgi:transcriptional regulator with XRE-family HTH domain
MSMTNERQQLWESLHDPQFRRQMIDEHINVGIAFQIRSIRKKLKLTQKALAELLGDKKKQPMISEWENPNYGNYTLATLKELAKAFDVGLLVRFVPFSTMVDWTVNVTNSKITPPSFGEEQYRVTTTAPSGYATAYFAAIREQAIHWISANVPLKFDVSATTVGAVPLIENESEKERVHA